MCLYDVYMSKNMYVCVNVAGAVLLDKKIRVYNILAYGDLHMDRMVHWCSKIYGTETTRKCRK